MALVDDVAALRDRMLAELDSAHDYHEDTRTAWRVANEAIAAGTTFATRNDATGTLTTQADLVRKTQGYVNAQLAEATFQQFIALFEAFFFDFLRLVLVADPRSLSGKKVEFKAILDAPDKESITLLVVDKELNEVLYERPAAWFGYLEGRVKLGCPSADEIARLAEAKATRDVLVHGRGVAGKIYESKAGKLARYRDGERIEIPEPYHRATWELVRTMVADISDAATAKLH